MFLYTSNIYPRGVNARERCPKKVVNIAPGVDHVAQSSLQFQLQLVKEELRLLGKKEIKVGFGILDFCTHSRRPISKNRFPHPISVADAICGTRFDLQDSKRRALEKLILHANLLYVPNIQM